jgi:hypothetical protein
MAKLKIADNADATVPSKRGYINVVDNLILNQGNYDAFRTNVDKKTRPTRLQGFAGIDENNIKCVVKHEPKNSAIEPIDDNNCDIEVHEDKRKDAGNPKSKYNVGFPEERPQNVDYLERYVRALYELYDLAVKEIDPVKKAKYTSDACKFMFGMMLLTRCR